MLAFMMEIDTNKFKKNGKEEVFSAREFWHQSPAKSNTTSSWVSKVISDPEDFEFVRLYNDMLLVGNKIFTEIHWFCLSTEP